MNWEDVIKNVITVPKGRMKTSNKPIPEEEEEDCVAHWQDAMRNNGISKNKLSPTGFSRQFLLQNGVPEKLWCNLKNHGVVVVSHNVTPTDMSIEIEVRRDYGLNNQELQEFSEFSVRFYLFYDGTADYFDIRAYHAETLDSFNEDKTWNRKFNLSARYRSDILTRDDLTRLFLDIHTAFAKGVGVATGDGDFNRFKEMLKDFREFDIKRTGGSLDGTYTKNIFDEELGYTYWSYFTGDYSNVGKGITKSLIQKPKGKLKTSNKPIPEEEEECKNKLMALIKKVKQSSHDDLLLIKYMPEVFKDEFDKKYKVYNLIGPKYKKRQWVKDSYEHDKQVFYNQYEKTTTNSIHYFEFDKWDSLPEEVACEALRMLKEVDYRKKLLWNPSAIFNHNVDTLYDTNILVQKNVADFTITIHGGLRVGQSYDDPTMGEVKGLILKIMSTKFTTLYVKVGIAHRDFSYLHTHLPIKSNFDDLSVEWWK